LSIEHHTLVITLENPMRRNPYFKQAAKRFLIGSRFKTPYEAVEAGARTLEEWSRVLLEERELERALERQLASRRSRRSTIRHVSA
jgi:hypothetical protein